jgi:hypothetical protein
MKGVAVDTLELYDYISELTLQRRTIPEEVKAKLKVKVPRNADVVQESVIKKESLKKYRDAILRINLEILDDADRMFRERILQALQYI